MFKDWDSDRALGLSTAVGVVDNCFGAEVSTSAVFSTPPSYSRLGPNNYIVSFGLSEV